MKKNTQKLSTKLSAVFVAVMLMFSAFSVYAATSSTSTKTITLDASAIATGGERFAAYLFDGNDSAKFVNMTASNGKYVVNVSTSYAQIIFCRMNGSISSNSWNNCWNQTADLKISDGNLYTLTGWGSGNKMNGYWKTTTATTAPTTTTTQATTTKATTTEATTNSSNGTFLAGTFNNWSTSANPITTTYRGGDVWLYLTPGYYEFKFVTVYNDGNSKSWVGSDSTITNSGTVSYSGSAGNIKLYVTEAGTYDFYMRMDMNRITVSKSS